MYQLSDFIPFQGNENKLVNGQHIVLAWSQKSGYHFTQAGFCAGGVKIIGVRDSLWS